jgi:plastocyanin
VRRLVPLTALLLLVAGGCGGDDSKPGRSVTAKGGSTLAVVADEYSFDPQTITVTGGGRLEVSLENRGALAHNLRVIDNGSELDGTDTITADKTSAAALDLDPGEYEFECTVGDHAELGMRGKISVR